MKKTKLRILLTALGFFALTATFGQVDTSKSSMAPGDSVSVTVPQGSPTATDSTLMNQDSTSMDHNSSSNQNLNSESSSASTNLNSESSSASTNSQGYDKADKKRLRAEKKEAKAEEKEKEGK